MMEMDWSALALGLAVGVAASAAFFAGLGWGMRIALKSGRPAIILILSAIMRIRGAARDRLDRGHVPRPGLAPRLRRRVLHRAHDRHGHRPNRRARRRRPVNLSPDATIIFEAWGVPINATVFFTWIVMALLTAVSMLITRDLRADVPPDRWRTTLEVIVLGIQSQIEEVARGPSRYLLYYAGTLFLFVAVSNLLLVVPGFTPPTASLSTTTALALSVLIAVPLFGVTSRGLGGYLKTYIEPSVIMLPFNIISEFSRGISLAIRLYGNIMSGAVIAAILLTVAPFFFPVVMDVLGLLTGMIQAYIFAILATVYISSATAPPRSSRTEKETS